MRIGTLIRNKYSKERIGVITRSNERYGSYTIHCIVTGEVYAMYPSDMEVLCEERND
mgnify:FL=1